MTTKLEKVFMIDVKLNFFTYSINANEIVPNIQIRAVSIKSSYSFQVRHDNNKLKHDFTMISFSDVQLYILLANFVLDFEF